MVVNLTHMTETSTETRLSCLKTVMTNQGKCDLCRILDLPKKLVHVYYVIFPMSELDGSKSLWVVEFRKR